MDILLHHGHTADMNKSEFAERSSVECVSLSNAGAAIFVPLTAHLGEKPLLRIESVIDHNAQRSSNQRAREIIEQIEQFSFRIFTSTCPHRYCFFSTKRTKVIG
ncbi:hypothetical protein CEXT_628941 [Caerostris extrusa]|uniref:Uncharacterized protein n=1 Tax=Caerostris extrusa TaxID=172846 RepID=A0AAV4X6C8_CAEEX|nr:hypothetical protein CEXT_628941 [Caerostris extrusa]